jgi:hypothetical protein
LSEKFQSRNQSQLPAVLVGPWAQPLFSALAIVLVGIDMVTIGRTRWAVAEGYIPSQSSFTDRALNLSRDRLHPQRRRSGSARQHHHILHRSGANRTLSRCSHGAAHVAFAFLEQSAPVPRDTDYSSVFESDVPIIVQYTRLDSRHAEVSLLSTTAYAEV